REHSWRPSRATGNLQPSGFPEDDVARAGDQEFVELRAKKDPPEVVSIPCLRISNAKQLLGSTVLCTCPWLTSQQRYFCCSTFCDTNGALETGAQFSPTLLPFFTTPIPSI